MSYVITTGQSLLASKGVRLPAGDSHSQSEPALTVRLFGQTITGPSVSITLI